MRDKGISKPQWVKLWAEKYYDDLCIEDIDELYPTAEEKSEFLMEVGKAFINALAYYNAYYEEDEFTIYNMNRDGLKLYKSLKRDIKQSYGSYERRIEAGRLGGRPKKGILADDD